MKRRLPPIQGVDIPRDQVPKEAAPGVRPGQSEMARLSLGLLETSRVGMRQLRVGRRPIHKLSAYGQHFIQVSGFHGVAEAGRGVSGAAQGEGGAALGVGGAALGVQMDPNCFRVAHEL